jgi:microcin C transport system substrate-binding protein
MGRFHFCCAACVLSSALLSCGPSDSTSATGKAPAVEDVPYELEEGGEFNPIANPRAVKGGTFTTWGGPYPKSLNMWLNYNSFSKSICELMFESLVAMHPTENRPIGVLAESWEVSDDQMTFTYTLRDRAVWSDGTPITSRDILFYYDTIMNPENLTSLFRVGLSRFERPEIVDEKTIRMRAREAHWMNFWEAASMTAFPSHSWEGKDFNSINFEFPVVSGPYRLHQINTNRFIMLQRRGDWWGRYLKMNQYTHNFDYLRFRSMEDRVKALEIMKRGDFDLYTIYTSRIWARQTRFDQVKKNWIIRQSVYNHEPKAFQGFAINMRRDKFKDVRIRKALAHLLNRELMMEKIMFNEYFNLNSYYPDLYPDNRNPEAPFIQYNPEKARQLFAEAGYRVNNRGLLEKDGEVFSVTLLHHGPVVPQLTIFIEELNKIGAQGNIDLVSMATHTKRLDNHEFDIAWRNWSATRLRNPEPMWHSKTADQVASQNVSGLQDERIDALIEKQKTLPDIDARNEILKQIDNILTELHPYILLWQSDRNRLLYWNRFGTPKYVLDKYNREDVAPVYWWLDREKDAALREAMRNNTTLPAEPDSVKFP